MPLPKILLVSVLSLLMTDIIGLPPDGGPACNQLSVKTEVSKAPDSGLSTLKVIVSGGKEPYRYVLLTPKGTLVSEDFANSEFNGLAAGKYRCIVVDEENCKKDLEIEL